MGVTGLEVVDESSEVDELDRLKGKPPPLAGVCVEIALVDDVPLGIGRVTESSWPSLKLQMTSSNSE